MRLKTKLVIAFMSVMILPTIFTTVAMQTFASQEAGEIQQLYLLVVFMTAAMLIYWIYKTVSRPLAKLQRAARNIKEGNLDFEMKIETDDEFGQLCQDFEAMRLRLKANAEEKIAYLAYEDQCTPANPRLPMISDMIKILDDSFKR